MSFYLLKRYAELRERYLQEHPKKRLFPTISKYARVIIPRDPIIRPGPKLEEAGRNMGLLLLVGLVALAVLKD